jgi:putative transcriptional regulator
MYNVKDVDDNNIQLRRDLLLRQLATSVLNLRNRRGYTQSALAEISSVPQRTICDLESGRANTTLQTLINVSTALGAPLAELFRNSWPYFETLESEKLEEANIFPPSNGVCEIHLEYEQKINLKIDVDRQVLLRIVSGEVFVRHSRDIRHVKCGEYLSSSGFDELVIICNEAAGANMLVIEFPKKEGRLW